MNCALLLNDKGTKITIVFSSVIKESILVVQLADYVNWFNVKHHAVFHVVQYKLTVNSKTDI